MEALFCRNRKEWREWLEINHESEKEIWLVYFKKHTKKETIRYEEAVEEALCYGWIDSLVKRIDNESYMQKYTPRKPKSVWSVINKNRVKKLIAENRMKDPGLAIIKIAKENGQWDKAYSSKIKQEIPKDFIKELKKHPKAYSNFFNFAQSYRNNYISWIVSAKREETRHKRIRIVIERSEENKKTGFN